MQGTYASFMTVAQSDPKKNTILFIDPGFPVQKQQCVVMGANYETFDVYHFRGDKLGDKLESYLATGRIAAIVYSNPNNPAWICLTEEELRTIGTLAAVMAGFIAFMYILPTTSCALVWQEWIIVGGWTIIGVLLAISAKKVYGDKFCSGMEID
jgi:hypothetical protein